MFIIVASGAFPNVSPANSSTVKALFRISVVALDSSVFIQKLQTSEETTSRRQHVQFFLLFNRLT